MLPITNGLPSDRAAPMASSAYSLIETLPMSGTGRLPWWPRRLIA
jgi:hypothetical protein